MSGPRIAGFELLDVIGRGGFGVVHRAREVALDRIVAVKVLTADVADSRALRSFEQEAHLLARLSEHPHVVTVLQTGRTHDGRPWVAMTWLPDGSLADHLHSHGPLPSAEVADIGVRLAGALATAHLAGILHLDVKPENVLRTRYGSPELADFGIARLVGATRATASVTASLTHAAPEVLDGAEPGPSADVYGLASTLHQLLTGRPAFEARSTAQLLAAVLTRPPPDLRARGVPQPLADVIATGMAKRPEDRQTSALRLAEALRDAQQGMGASPTEVVVLSPATPSDVPTRVPPDAGVTVDDATMRHRPSAPQEPPGTTAPRTPTRPVADEVMATPTRPVHRSRRRSSVVAAVAVAAAAVVAVSAGMFANGTTTPDATPSSGAPSTASPTPSATTTGIVAADGTACDLLAAPVADDRAVSLDVAFDTAEAGDVLCLTEGDYTSLVRPTRGGSPGAPLVVTPAADAAVTLRGGLLVTGDLTHVTVRGLTITRDTEPTVRIFGDSIVFEDNDVSGTGTCLYVGDALQGTAENAVVRRNHLHDCGPTDEGAAAGISLGSTQTATITDNFITRVARRGIVLYPDADNTVVEHNTLVGVGTPLDVGGVAEDELSEGMSARRNVLVSSSGQGVRTTYENGVSAEGHNHLVADNCLWPATATIDEALPMSGNVWVEPTVDEDGVVTDGCIGMGVRPTSP